jgi:hypothetical protein
MKLLAKILKTHNKMSRKGEGVSVLVEQKMGADKQQ